MHKLSDANVTAKVGSPKMVQGRKTKGQVSQQVALPVTEKHTCGQLGQTCSSCTEKSTFSTRKVSRINKEHHGLVREKVFGFLVFCLVFVCVLFCWCCLVLFIITFFCLIWCNGALHVLVLCLARFHQVLGWSSCLALSN